MQMDARLFTLSALALEACAGAPPHDVVVPVDKPVSPAAVAPVDKEDTGTLTLIAAAKPGAFVVDGNIAEWGSLVPPPPKKKKASDSPEPQKKPKSHVAVALHPEGFALAAELSPTVGDSFWLALSFDRPDVPSIGVYMRGGSIMPMLCENEDTAAQMSPDDLAECKKLVENHDKFTGEYLARFESFYKISPKGVALFKNGALIPVAGAKVVVKPAEQGFTAEVSFPAKGLPRALQAPVQEFAGYAVVAKGNQPESRPPDEWDHHDLPQPVGFEPYAELRELALSAAQARQVNYRPYKPHNISYQPGEGLEVEDVDYPGDSYSVAAMSKVLYSKLRTMGDVEVGHIYTGMRGPGAADMVSFLSMYKGKPVATFNLIGEEKGMVERDGELHVFAYWHQWPDDSPAHTAEWSVSAVGPDGSIRSDIIETGVMPPRGWFDVTDIEDPDFTTFGLLATEFGNEDGPGEKTTISWQYDKKERAYLVRRQKTPAPKNPGKPKKPKK